MERTSIIYTIKTSEFTVAGKKYDVSNVLLSIPHNGIPSCSVGIAPADGEGDIIINALDLVSLKDAYDSLSKDALKLEKSNLNIEIESNFADGSGGGTFSGLDQKLEIKDWLLKEVGLSQVSTTSPFTLMCVLYHPVIQLTLRSGFYFDSSTTVNLEKYCEEVENPLQAAQVTIKTLQEANKKGIETLCTDISTSTELKTPDEVNETLKKAVDKVKEQLDPNGGLLKWDPSFSGGTFDLPMQDKITGRYKKGLQYALAQSWLSSDKQSSAWNTLQNVVMPWFALELADTWDEDTLSIVPVMPWKKVEFGIEDFMVSEIELPGNDPNPIYGCILYEGPGSVSPEGVITYAKGAGEATAVQPANLAFVPKNADDSIGSLLHVGKPEWIDMAATKATSMDDIEVDANGEVTYSQETEEPLNPGGGDNEDLELWNAVKMQHLANTFMSSYRQGVSSSMVGALMIKDRSSGKTIVPGKVASVITDGKPVFTGMITLIEHGINCERSTAYTKINMNYCQAPDSSNNVLGAAPLLPYYNSLP